MCAVCYDEHDMGECYIASSCGHKLCRKAARGVLLAAIECATTCYYAARYVILFCMHILSRCCNTSQLSSTRHAQAACIQTPHAVPSQYCPRISCVQTQHEKMTVHVMQVLQLPRTVPHLPGGRGAQMRRVRAARSRTPSDRKRAGTTDKLVLQLRCRHPPAADH